MKLWRELRDLGIEDVWCIDAEFLARKGERVIPRCVCGRSSVTGREIRQFADVKRHGKGRQRCPFPQNKKTLFVSYSAPAEWSYFLVKGWPLPLRIIDLYAEACLLENGRSRFPSLLSTAAKFGVDAMEAAEKTEMRDLAMMPEGYRYTKAEQAALLEYCMSDAILLEKLFLKMLPLFNMREALDRGSYTRPVAASEFFGVPADVAVCCDLKNKLPRIRSGLAASVERKHHFGVYVPNKKGLYSWNREGLAALIRRKGLERSWDKTETGQFSDSDETLKAMAQRFPELEPLRVTRRLLDEFKSFDLPLGEDGRVRVHPFPWASLTGRNQPKRGDIFKLPKVLRHLIRPKRGMALGYADVVGAEFGIAAGTSRDREMCESYQSGKDVYLRLAHLAGVVPEDATKESHHHERALYKTAMLAAMYGQMPQGLARATGISCSSAAMVHKNLRRSYSQYFLWRHRAAARAEANGFISSKLGWSVPVSYAKEIPVERRKLQRFLYNFPIQSAGADILRLAATMMYDKGIRILAMVHDAVLIEDTSKRIEKSVAIAQQCWNTASAEILNGFELRSDAKIVRWPRRYAEEDAGEMWDLLMKLRKKMQKRGE